MAASPKSILDLSVGGLKKIEKRDGVGVKHLILDNNELTKLENMDCFPDLEKLSASGNAIVRMLPVAKCHYLTHINLSNNNLIGIEALKDLHNLTFLNLSVNRIKVIHNFVHTENLIHIDLSKNDITCLDAMHCVSKLKILYLSGNKISSLEKASKLLPHSLCVFDVSDNTISDLNEVSHLVSLESLEQLTISGNPCVKSKDQQDALSFDYRPFVINWCLGLRLLDGYVCTQKESLRAEWLYSQGKGRHFKTGDHNDLVEYLVQVCPANLDKLVDEEDEKLSRVLQMQRQHKKEFLSEMSQSMHPEQVSQVKRKMLRMTNSYHASNSSQIPMSRHTSNEPSRIMYESAPEVLFDSIEPVQSSQNTSSSTEGSPHLLSKSELLHNSARSPITIEQVSVEGDKPKKAGVSKSQAQYSDERRLRPSTAEVATNQSRGSLVRKVSRRSTSPNVACPSPGKPKVALSHRSKISPSRSCILNAKLSISKNSSESDTSEELSHSSKSFRRGMKSYNTPQSCSPVFRQKLNSDNTPTKDILNVPKPLGTTFTALEDSCIVKTLPLSLMLSQKYNATEEKLINSAIKIQSVWRGYRVRHCNQKIYKLRQETRFRRMEDHIQHLHGHMCRLTDFVLRQQKDLQHERELRKLQAEDIRNLHEKAKELEKDVSLVLMKAKNDFQKVSEHYSLDIQNLGFSRKCVSKDSKSLPNFEPGRLLQDISPDSPSSSMQYSAQTVPENSCLFSPSSQTSSVPSIGGDGTLSQSLSHHFMQPSMSDLSDGDSGLHSMVSPNLNAFLEAEKNLCSEGAFNSISDTSSMLPSFHRKQSGRCNSDNQDRPFVHIRGKNAQAIPLCSPLTSCGSKAYGNNICITRDDLPSEISCSDRESNEFRLHSGTETCNPIRRMLGNIHFDRVYTENSIDSPYDDFDNLEPQKDSDPEQCCSFPLKKDASLSPIFPYPPNQSLPVVTERSIPVTPEFNITNRLDRGDSGQDKNTKLNSTNQYSHNSQNFCSARGLNKRCSDPAVMGFASAKEKTSPTVCTIGEKSKIINVSRTRPSVFNKGLVLGNSSNSTTPLDDCKSPQSPCTVEMSGRISHSCSFQSDGFTTAEELSATTTVKLFSARTMSMTCGSPQSPQTAIQRPLSLNDPIPQGNIRSPLILATHMWEKKVQDIESTFQHLQAQIRELEGAFGHCGQLSYIYPSLLSDDSKDSRHLIHCLDPTAGSLVLDMPKVNFKHGNSSNSDLYLQTHFGHHGANGIPSLPPSNSSAQSSEFCHVEEIEQDSQGINKKCLKLPLTDKAGSESNNNNNK